MLKLEQTTQFSKTYKKPHKNQQEAIDDAIQIILASPIENERKKGDLVGLYVYKFQMLGQLTLLAYRYFEDEQIIRLIAVGSHENFYRDIKRN